MQQSNDDRVRIADAAFPKPFSYGLEFNAPAHGTWNIVHIGFKIPEAHQIYVCADNCMRGVVMTAAEMGELRRFSSVILEEDDMVHSGRLEETTIEGITDVLHSLEKVPPVVIVFPVCVHRFMGCDMDYIYGELNKRFPEVKFVRGFMDPVMQKRSTTPDQRLRKAMFDIIPELPSDGSVSVIGCDMRMDDANDIKKLLALSGKVIRDEADIATLDDYYSLGRAEYYVCSYPAGLLGASALSIRTKRPYRYLPFTFGYDAVDEGLRSLGIDIPEGFFEAGKKRCDEAASVLKDAIGNTEIQLDYTAVPRPLSLARFLLERGFDLTAVYADAFDPDEQRDYEWLAANHPDLLIRSTVHVQGRRPSRSENKILAIGQKAAWFTGTEYFVNMIEGGGLYGYSGIEKFLRLMEEAYNEPKDTRDIIPRKGIGCASLV